MSEHNDFDNLYQEINRLFDLVKPKRRARLAVIIKGRLAKSQKARIQQQKNPDGSDYVPRRPPAFGVSKRRIKKGDMFRKIRLNRFMRAKANADEIAIGFTGREAGIAAVHQFGKLSTVLAKRNLKHKYDKREILGFSKDDLEMIEQEILQYLSGKK